MMVVLEIEEIVQDGREIHAKLFPNAEIAVKYINDRPEPWGCQIEYRLFEVGKEIHIKAEQVPEHKEVVVKEKTVFKLDKKKGKR